MAKTIIKSVPDFKKIKAELLKLQFDGCKVVRFSFMGVLQKFNGGGTFLGVLRIFEFAMNESESCHSALNSKGEIGSFVRKCIKEAYETEDVLSIEILNVR